MRRYLILTILVSGIALTLWGCSKLSLSGHSLPNHIPIVYLGNVPPDSSKFSANPRIYWYGMDPDGYIIRYQYVVIPESEDSLGHIKNLNMIPRTPDGQIDSLFVKALESIPPESWIDTLISKYLEEKGFSRIPVDSMVAVDDSVTEANIRMFATVDTQVFVSQYLFVRAVDNSKGISQIWKPGTKGGNTFRRFSRNNHAPDTHINFDKFDRTLVYYCLDDTTKTWGGIEILWEGSDSADYPRKQPDFLYKWELLGPFSDTSGINPYTTDTPVMYFSYDSLLDTRWLKNKSKLFWNLKNYHEKLADDLKSGWYLFRVKSKDDALAEDSTPAYTFFRVVHPYFTYAPQRRVLLVDASMYKSLYGIMVPYQVARNYYRSILGDLSGEMGFDTAFWVDPYSDPYTKHLPPNELTLSLYDLVIVMHYGGKEEALSSTGASIPTGGSASSDSGYVQYKRYLDVGGRVWFIGVNDFALGAAATRGYYAIDQLSRTSEFFGRDVASDLARYYFGISGIYYPNWVSGGADINEEFIAAAPFSSSSGFPELKVDSFLTATTIWTNPDFVPNHKGAVPHVDYEVLRPQTERVYTFVSYQGSQSEMDGRPCACRFIGSTFRTAEFCFPLFVIDKEASKKVFRLMIEWFFEDNST
jgi:hypothetical protein